MSILTKGHDAHIALPAKDAHRNVRGLREAAEELYRRRSWAGSRSALDVR